MATPYLTEADRRDLLAAVAARLRDAEIQVANAGFDLRAAGYGALAGLLDGAEATIRTVQVTATAAAEHNKA